MAIIGRGDFAGLRWGHRFDAIAGDIAGWTLVWVWKRRLDGGRGASAGGDGAADDFFGASAIGMARGLGNLPAETEIEPGGRMAKFGERDSEPTNFKVIRQFSTILSGGKRYELILG